MHIILFKKKLETLCVIILGSFFTVYLGCRENKVDDNYIWKSMEVTATAYNSLPAQTSKIHPNITAWGDSLSPGMKVIAVSQDLIPLGLDHNTPVKLEGDSTTYIVKDKMNPKWKNRIDIYMGEDKARALEWGRKKITIRYRVRKDSTKIE